MSTYRVELEDDEFEIINADSDDEAMEIAQSTYEFFYNVDLLDENFEYVKTIF